MAADASSPCFFFLTRSFFDGRSILSGRRTPEVGLLPLFPFGFVLGASSSSLSAGFEAYKVVILIIVVDEDILHVRAEEV